MSSDNLSESKMPTKPDNDLQSGATTGDLSMSKLRTGCAERPTGPNFASESLPESGRTGPSKPLHAELKSDVSDELPLHETSAGHGQTKTTSDSPGQIGSVAVRSYHCSWSPFQQSEKKDPNKKNNYQ